MPEHLYSLPSQLAKANEGVDQLALSSFWNRLTAHTSSGINSEGPGPPSMSDDILWETASITTTQASENCPTPTGSTMSDDTVKSEDGFRRHSVSASRTEHHPRADKFFLIRTLEKPHRLITLQNGQLQAATEPPIGGGWVWYCCKLNGWYGFRNTVSGTYIGHDSREKIIAMAPHHRAHEYFMAERHEDGGYVMKMRHGDELWEVAIGDDGTTLVENKTANGTPWEFVEVDNSPWIPILEVFNS